MNSAKHSQLVTRFTRSVSELSCVIVGALVLCITSAAVALGGGGQVAPPRAAPSSPGVTSGDNLFQNGAGDVIVTVRPSFSPLVVGRDGDQRVSRRHVVVRDRDGVIVGVRLTDATGSAHIPVPKGAVVHVQIEGVARGVWVRDGSLLSVSLP